MTRFMGRRRAGVVALVAAVGLSGMSLAAQQRGGTAAPGDGLKVVGTVRDIMVGLVMPASDIVFNAGAEPPKTDAEWGTVRRNAVLLAESANLILVGSRVRDRGDWVKMAVAQRDAAEAVVKAATAKDAAALAEAGDKAYETCTTCHNKYWADRNQPK